MSVEGSLDLFQLPEILQIIAQQRKTGILTVQGENDIVAVTFLKGDVVGADSLNQTGEEALAALLVEEGLLAPSEVSEALNEVSVSGEQLHSVLVEKRFLDRSQLLSALRMQYLGLLHRVLGWQEGDFKFYANDEVSFEEGLEAIEVQGLLLGAASQESELSMEGSPAEGLSEADFGEFAEDPVLQPPQSPPEDVDLEAVFERVPSARPIRVRSGMPGEEEGDYIFLSPTEQQLLSRIDGRRTIRDLMKDGSLDWQTAVSTAESLEGLALVRRRQFRQPEEELAEEVFEPPPLDDAFLGEGGHHETHGRRAVVFSMDSTLALGSVLLAFVALAWLLGAFASFPGSFLLPFPWQGKERAAFEGQQRAALYLKVDRGAKTFFLLDGQFPERLQSLAGRHLIGVNDLRDPRSRPLRYEPSDIRYELAPVEQGEPIAELAADEAITGDFLLDLDFYSIDDREVEQPLVLLD
ncbi:MAG: DUF4388 domain-containing protein [Deltaproteobacteria bacterium]|nr:DUF4388 domain-containing protein [Deltaproteobacteria bacterium]